MSLAGRIYAAGFDQLAKRQDDKGEAALRELLVAEARGEVLEVGTGTGRCLRYYRDASSVVALEPDPDMRVRAVRRGERATVPVEVVAGDGMALSYPDDSFDTVVFGWVLCTIPNPGAALGEARRVLRPGGAIRICEHVRSEEPGLARWQDRLARPWRWFARGCRANQDTVQLLAEAGFDTDQVQRFDFRPSPPLTRPHLIGVASATPAPAG